jgi:hypothetical protein
MTEVTFSFLDLSFPPGGLSEFFSALALNPDMTLDGIIVP